MKHEIESEWRSEIFSAILIALATVATAWCAYQATLWGGIQTFRLSEAGAAGREGASLWLEAQQERALDAAIFMEYLAALTQKNDRLVEFYSRRIPDFKVALDAWLATNPFENPNAPAHPFVMPQYSRPEEAQAEARQQVAADRMAEAREANRISDAYVLNTVLMALVLFFSGIATKFAIARIRVSVLASGALILAAGLARVASLPITSG